MYNLGIDFGNSFVSVSAFCDDQPDILEMYDKSDSVNNPYIMPVSAYIDEENRILVGYEAEEKRIIDPLRYRNNFKVNLGNKVPYLIKNEEIDSTALCREVLKYIRSRAVKKYGNDMGKSIITYPSNFPEYKVELLKKAAFLAGLGQVELVDDASAAVAYECFANNYKPGSIFLIFDVGGTTFDLTIKLYEVNGLKNVIAPIAVNFCGGFDFQRKIFDDIVEQNSAVYNRAVNEGNFELIKELEVIAEKTKFRLDNEEKVKIEAAVGNEFINYEISRTKYDNLISDYVSTTIKLTNQALQKANLSNDDIRSVIFVGGSNKTPSIQKRVCSMLGQYVIKNKFPEMTVSMGAAILASDSNLFTKEVCKEVNSVKIGSRVILGKYYDEDIVWRIAAETDKSYTAVCEKVICFKAFDALGSDEKYHKNQLEMQYGSGSWEFSALRSWLNSDAKKVNYTHLPPSASAVWFNAYDEEPGFLSNFDNVHKNMLLHQERTVLISGDSKNTNEELHQFNADIKNAVSNYDASMCKKIKDKVFLPSVKFAAETLTDCKIGYNAKPTEAAVIKCESTFGEELSADTNCSYWLDTPYAFSPEYVRVVTAEGLIDKKESCDGTVGVRPVINLVKNFYVISGDGTEDNPYKVII